MTIDFFERLLALDTGFDAYELCIPMTLKRSFQRSGKTRKTFKFRVSRKIANIFPIISFFFQFVFIYNNFFLIISFYDILATVEFRQLNSSHQPQNFCEQFNIS